MVAKRNYKINIILCWKLTIIVRYSLYIQLLCFESNQTSIISYRMLIVFFFFIVDIVVSRIENVADCPLSSLVAKWNRIKRKKIWTNSRVVKSVTTEHLCIPFGTSPSLLLSSLSHAIYNSIMRHPAAWTFQFPIFVAI